MAISERGSDVMTSTGPDSMTVVEAAQELGVTSAQVYTYIREGYLGQRLRKTLYRGRSYVSRADVAAIKQLRSDAPGRPERLFNGEDERN